MISRLSRIGLVAIGLVVLPVVAAAQTDSGTASQPAATPAQVAPAAPPATAKPADVDQPRGVADAPRLSGEKTAASAPSLTQPSSLPVEVTGTSGGTGRTWTPAAPSPRGRFDQFYLPEIELPASTWFAIVIILALTLSSRPLGTTRSLDGFMLAVSGALLVLRGETAYIAGGISLQTAVFALLTLVGVYWLFRGWQTVRAMNLPRNEPNVAEGPLLVLAIASIAIAGAAIANAPLSRSSQDGMVGGVYMVESGKLPYGTTIGYDGRAPLLYMLHAGAIRATQSLLDFGDSGEVRPGALMPTVDAADGPAPLTWDQRTRWAPLNWWEHGTLQAARLVNAGLFLLTLLAVNFIGRRLHSPAMGLTMAAIFSVFPGTIECINHPDVMLPTMLLAWSVACALLPGIGGFLSVLLCVFAGACWPWAWLGIPVLLAHLMRRGAAGVGGLLGVAVGIVAMAYAVNTLAEPGIPRATGALAAAGATPHMAAKLDGKSVHIENMPPLEGVSNIKTPLWKFLIADDVVKFTPPKSGSEITLGAGVDAQNMTYSDIDVSDAASDTLLPLYREASAGGSFRSKLRTVLEAVWLPARGDDTLPPSPWAVWFGDSAEYAVVARQAMKIVAIVLSLAIAFVVYTRRLSQSHQLLGALLATFALIQLATQGGAGSELALVAVLITTLVGANSPIAAAPGHESAVAAMGKPPRISTER